MNEFRPPKSMAKLSLLVKKWIWQRSSPAAAVSVLLIAFAVIALSRFHWQPFSRHLFGVERSVGSLLWLLLLLGIYMAYKQLQIERIQRRSNDRDEIFRLIGEHAADMIAVVDVHGNRLYNTPSYKTALGYSPEELEASPAFEHVHPDDRGKVISAAQRAHCDGVGTRLEYRIRHKNGLWRVFESTSSAVREASGEITKLVIVNRDITERKELEQRLKHTALHDALTGLPNRNLFMNRLRRAFDRAKSDSHYVFAVLLIDVDDFKVFNDTLGHHAGDQVLVEIGRRLAGCLRFDDIVSRPTVETTIADKSNESVLARFGGDEFTVLVGNIMQPTDALRVAKRVQEILSLPIAVNGQEVFTSASVGIALSTIPHASADDLLRHADIAMYRAKAHGKAGAEIFETKMHTTAVDRLKIETDLRKGLERQEFVLHYQPIVLLRTGRIVGFEALIRWKHPERGLQSPDAFVPVAERMGLIVPIGNWVLRESCRRLRSWQEQHPSKLPLSVSVNVSAKQFDRGDLVNEIYAVLRETGIRPDSLQLEITESLSMGYHGDITRILFSLKAVGIRISIDDFGTGYSSLSRLHRLPADVLKIDRSFVARMTADGDEREIVRHIITLASSLHLRTIAEGIETRKQADLLSELGCEFGQGYLFSKPVDEQTAEGLLRDNCRLGFLVQ